MTVLIADDEYYVRSDLKAMLFELNMDITVVGEACDGEELYLQAKQFQPDLALIDIKMPKSDGLNTINKMKDCCPDTVWVIISGFSEFEYAREAVNLGVAKYLLKPISSDELKSIVESTIASSAEKQAKLNIEFGHEIEGLLNDLITLSEFDSSNAILFMHFMVGTIILDSSMEENEIIQIEHKFYSEIYSLNSKYVNTYTRVALSAMPNGDPVVVFAWRQNNEKEGTEEAKNYFFKLANLTKRFHSVNFCITVVKGNECENFISVFRQLNQIQNLSLLRMVTENEGYISINKLKKQYQSLSAPDLKLIEIVKRIVKSYKETLYFEYHKAVDDFESCNFSQIKIDFKTLFKFISCSCNLSEYYWDNDQKNTLIKALRNSEQRILSSMTKHKDLVELVTSFIDHNYMNDIGITQIAEQLHVTPNYLSTLFHKKTGENFMHYLTKVRLMRAREMLAASDHPHVNQIAKQVGYYTVNYFTKLYKNYFGVCPSDDIGTPPQG